MCFKNFISAFFEFRIKPDFCRTFFVHLKKFDMKKRSFVLFFQALFLFSALSICNGTSAQSSKDRVIIEDVDSARAEFIRTDALMKSLFDSAYGYVVFPNIGKGAIGVGGASG